MFYVDQENKNLSLYLYIWLFFIQFTSSTLFDLMCCRYSGLFHSVDILPTLLAAAHIDPGSQNQVCNEEHKMLFN